MPKYTETRPFTLAKRICMKILFITIPWFYNSGVLSTLLSLGEICHITMGFPGYIYFIIPPARFADMIFVFIWWSDSLPADPSSDLIHFSHKRHDSEIYIRPACPGWDLPFKSGDYVSRSIQYPVYPFTYTSPSSHGRLMMPTICTMTV